MKKHKFMVFVDLIKMGVQFNCLQINLPYTKKCKNNTAKAFHVPCILVGHIYFLSSELSWGKATKPQSPKVYSSKCDTRNENCLLSELLLKLARH